MTRCLFGDRARRPCAALMTWVVLRLTNALVGLRVSVEQEIEGLDVVSYNESGYDL